ncbi:MAG: tetratricopeptide repeat protein, partial [Pseudomonadota bacterium]
MQVLSSMQDEQGIEAELRRMVERFPDDLTIRGNFLRFLVARGQTDDAETFLRTLVTQAENAQDRDTQQTTLVQFILQTRGVEAALEELRSALEENPGSITLVTVKASLDFDTGRTEEAMQDLQTILENAPENASVEQLMNTKVVLARMLQRDGNEVGARRQVEEILETEAGNVAALKMQAAWMIEDDATNDAITALRTALGENSQDTEAMLLMAEAYKRSGNQALRLDFLSLAAEASNNAPNTALRYAEALAQDGRLTQAESVLISALRIQPRNTDVLGALGTLYVTMDDMSRLRDVIRTLEDIDSNIARGLATNFRVQLLQAESGLEEAIGYLEQVAEAEQGDAARLALIRGHLLNRDTDQALALVEDLLAQDPENPTYLYTKSLALIAAEDFDAAIAEMSALLDKSPGATEVWLQLARLQGLSGDSVAAANTIDEALAANPDSGNLLWAKAVALEQSGDIEEAIEIYEQLYAINSNSVIVANNLASMLATYRRDDECLARAEVVARRLRGTQNIP